MRRNFLLALPILALSAVPVWAQSSAVSGQITVSGEAVAFATPDMATIQIGAQGRGATPAEALNQTSAALEAMIARLKDNGIEARDIQTSGLSLNEDRIWDRDKQVDVSRGYVASNMLMIRVRDLSQLGGLLSVMVEDGANTLSGVSFGVSETDALENQARRDAVADALAKAELYADAAGVALGPILSINEGGISAPMPIMRSMKDVVVQEAVADVPVAAGEISSSANVTIVFAIGE
ncbi:SIMPL domain-containing protein [Pseudoprimorskyibacter insulae]|uniref:26 kDa periplasmic immunogenic protein n=1 Tax=Pseudoprimorskyibacter insulae TaxID=1695997 RepID=A0A2R8AQX0_9RHOB|nr:SIMPL domain-containing protein [Pseudoprimorskyibacter insulae]SPF78415.1 26 kDa periplasmic immunogenic protein [Pseudoprimorskyibacter insulae]